MSASAFLASAWAGTVILLEQEAVLAHHTTGRSAAQFIANLGAGPIRPLSIASLDFFRQTPDGLSDVPLLTQQPALLVAEPGQDEVFSQILADGQGEGGSTQEIGVDEATQLFPLLRPETITRAMIERNSASIDVAATHQAFVRLLKRHGGEIAMSTRVDAVTAEGGGWRIETAEGTRFADLVVNAAGAWGDVVAARAGIAPIGQRPLRRTAFMVRSPVGAKSAEWPMLINVDHDWYTKPDGPQFLCSPADEIFSEPCDAKPRELDVALAIDRINAATNLDITSVTAQWAGLRTFSPDRSMVIGPEPGTEHFVWCVGQGGTGIQTSPAVGQLVADLVVGNALGPSFGSKLDMTGLLPDRFRHENETTETQGEGRDKAQ